MALRRALTALMCLLGFHDWRHRGDLSGGREAIAEAFTRGQLEHVVPLALPKGGEQ